MERIIKYIEKLLVRNEYVVVPGFGGFVLQHEPARIEGSVLFPPHKVLAFNSLMCHSDGLLEIEISRSEQVSFRQAQEVIKDVVSRFNVTLFESKSAFFGNFGRFDIHESSILVFLPTEFPDFIPANFGLRSVLLQQHQSPLASSITQPVILKTISIRNVMRYAAMILIFMGLFFVSENVNREFGNQTASVVNINSFVTHGIKHEVYKVVAKPDLAKSKKTEAIQVNDSDLYHVIVASMPTVQSAESYCKMLAEKSYAGAHVLMPVKTYRVAIKSFARKSEAIEFMEQLRQSDKLFETAWVLCK